MIWFHLYEYIETHGQQNIKFVFISFQCNLMSYFFHGSNENIRGLTGDEQCADTIKTHQSINPHYRHTRHKSRTSLDTAY